MSHATRTIAVIETSFNHERIWNRLSEHLTLTYGMRIKFKSESRLMRLIGAILFFNPAFKTQYITTIGKTIYFPSRVDILNGRMWDVLAHEGIHLHDNRKWYFSLAYLFPQILGILSLLSIFAVYNVYFLLFSVFLVALLPFPAPYRVRAERRGYLMSMIADIIRYGESWVNSDYYRKCMTEFLTGPGYYYMYWETESAGKIVDLDRAIARMIASGDSNMEPFATFTQIIRASM